jgi:hypothetical protein
MSNDRMSSDLGSSDLMRSDLSTDLAFGVLTPASAAGALDRQAAHKDAGAKARRRSRGEAEEENSDDLSAGSEGDEAPPHQLDHLA